MADDNFQTVIDDMVSTLLCQRDPRTGEVILNVPSHEEMGCWLLDSSAANGDVGLLECLNFLREQYVLAPVPQPQPRGRDYPDLPDVQGEIPWRTLHCTSEQIGSVLVTISATCSECGHDQLYHDREYLVCTHGEYLNDGGWPCYPCNCGNNIGR